MFARAINYLSYLALFCAYTAAGFTVSFNDQFMKNMVDIMYPGMPIPALSLFMLALEKLIHPGTTGAIIGIIFAIALAVLDRNPRAQKWLPTCLTIGWSLCVLYLVAAIWAMALLLPIRFTHI